MPGKRPFSPIEAHYFDALKRISGYVDPERLRKSEAARIGLEYAEALEYAYENMRDEARRAIYRQRRPREPKTVSQPLAPAPDQPK
jgi:hypothetical protein